MPAISLVPAMKQNTLVDWLVTRVRVDFHNPPPVPPRQAITLQWIMLLTSVLLRTPLHGEPGNHFSFVDLLKWGANENASLRFFWDQTLWHNQ